MEEKLEKIYQLLIEGTTLTTQNLSAVGIASEDLTNLEQSGKLVKTKEDEYILSSVENLFRYGEKLLRQGTRDKANACFLKCYEMNPTHSRVCLRLFHNSAYNMDCEKSIEYFSSLYENEKRLIYRKDNNLYLLLLNEWLKLPAHLASKAKSLTLEDILFDKNEFCFYDKEQQNRIRTLIFQHKIEEALNEIPQKIDSCLALIKILCNKILKVRRNYIENEGEKILKFLRNREYYALICYLEGKETLSIQEEVILKLSKTLLEIRNRKIVPEKKCVTADDLFMAIDMNDYEQALEISKSQERSTYNSSIRMLLEEIILRISELEKNKSNIENEVLNQEDQAETIKQIEEEQKIQTVMEPLPDLTSIFDSLRNKDVEQAIENFHLYLKKSGKEQYAFLIDNLIKVSLLEQDMIFVKTIVGLVRIYRESFILDISPYVEDYYDALLRGNFEKAMLYCNIILDARTNNRFQIEELLKHDFEYFKNCVSLPTPEIIAPSELEAPVGEDATLNKKQAKPLEVPEQAVSNTPKVIEQKQEDLLETYTEEKLKELEQVKGIILLEPMTSSERKRIHYYVETLPYAASFSIGEGINRRLVLRYIDKDNEYISFRDEFKQSNDTYKEEDYRACIESNLRLLSCSRYKANAGTYARLGICYAKIGETKKAIDFLTVATELNRKSNDVKYDFTEFIGRLKGLFDEDDIKPFVKVKLEEFETPNDNISYVANLETISKMVSEQGLSIDEACIELGMNLVEANLVKLEYARFNYMEGQDKIGDRLLKAVEKSEYKDEQVIALIDEIRRNKRLYRSKLSEARLPYVLRIPIRKIF